MTVTQTMKRLDRDCGNHVASGRPINTDRRFLPDVCWVWTRYDFNQTAGRITEIVERDSRGSLSVEARK